MSYGIHPQPTALHMLASMRTTASSFVMKALMLFLVLSFAVWGVGDMVRGGTSGNVATVDGDAINLAGFSRAVNDMRRGMESMGLRDIEQGVVVQQVLRRKVEEKLVARRISELGLHIDKELLAARLREAPMFHDLRGKFDPALFKATLEQRQMSEPAFLEDLKTDIRSSVFTASLTTEGLMPPAALAEFRQVVGRERRSVLLATISASALQVPPVDDDAVMAYYEANKELLYVQPESRTLEYAVIDHEALLKTAAAAVTADQVNEQLALEGHAEDATDEQRTQARRDLEAQAAESAVEQLSIQVEDALAAGSSMGEAIALAGAAAQSHMLKNITQQPYAQHKDALIKAVVARGFAMQSGETSGIETSENGLYYMVATTEVTPSAPQPFESVAADARKRAEAKARTAALRAKADEVKAALESADAESAVKKLGATLRVVENVARPESEAGGALNPALAAAVYEHTVGEVAGPLIESGTAQLAKITATRFTDDAKPVDSKTLEALAGELQNDVLRSYYQTLLKRHPVTVNQPILQQLVQQGGGE